MQRLVQFVLAILATIGVILAAVVVIGAVQYGLSPTYPIESGLDHGGRWNYRVGECECTPEELASPTVTKELVAHCDKPAPRPTSGSYTDSG